MRVVIAPDSFKGSLDAAAVAAALVSGWRSARPADEMIAIPMADGGEGTASVVAAQIEGARWVDAGPVSGPDGRPVDGRWVLLPDGAALVELAISSGLPLMSAPDPLCATTAGLGQTLLAAVEAGARRVIVGLGGSASTDGAAGALRALGLRILDAQANDVPDGGAALLDARYIDDAGLKPPPPGGVDLLVDVDSPLLGPRGAAAVFAPQKGADADDVALLERAMRHWAGLLGGEPAASGAGAAGGAAYGLAAGWGGRLVSGARSIADLVGLDAAIAAADVVVTGEGAFDATSLEGKACGEVVRRCAAIGKPAFVVAGRLDVAPPGGGLSLTELAGGADVALRDAARWLHAAGERAARMVAGR